MDFTHIKYGVVLATIAILFGGVLGLSFGCCEENIKTFLNSSANAVRSEKYEDKQERVDKVVKKSWIYFKRAHLHSQTMGVIAIVFSLLAAWLGFQPRIQLAISTLGGLGSMGYGVFWLSAAVLAPGMGSTGAAKEAVGLVAQFSGAAFFIAGATLFATLIYRMFIQPRPGTGAGDIQ